jgi:phosphodiesterase/alkaline phosphatase D-like protein
MRKLLLVLAITFALVVLLCPTPTGAQVIPPARKSARVQITEGPKLESAQDTWAIVTWTSNNPVGSDEHFGVVHFGKTPSELQQTAKSHIRLNQGHSYTVFRVRVLGLQPRTTYYYKVDSENASGSSDGVSSPVRSFTTQ